MGKAKEVSVGLIGGGLMGREAASAFGRWFVFKDMPVKPLLKAVCDLNQDILDWYKNIGTVEQFTTEYHELLANKEIEVVYVALPHNLHEKVYLDVLKAGKDLIAEKPFGIDLKASKSILSAITASSSFVRCSSEFPYFPAVQRQMDYIKQGKLGKLMEIRSGFLHSSDMNMKKPINWKRQIATCGEVGVMGDLGMHALHVPLRLGWKPANVYAQLQNIVRNRPDGKGGMAECDTWDNAVLHCEVQASGDTVHMQLEMKRMAAGETNTWYLEAYGTEGAVRFSTKNPKTLWIFDNQNDQAWIRKDIGFESAFPTITGAIFEFGFPDCFQQMLAAYFLEREGLLEGRFGCVTPEEAVNSQEVFAAALSSHNEKRAVAIA